MMLAEYPKKSSFKNALRANSQQITEPLQGDGFPEALALQH